MKSRARPQHAVGEPTAAVPPLVTPLAPEAVPASPASIFTGPLRTTSVGILVLITFVAFEALAVATALPTAATHLHGLAHYGWAFTGFLAANVLGMVTSGQVSDTRGPRLPLVAGIATFLLGLILAGSAVTMAQLVTGRVVQGLGSGALITAVYVVIGGQYPESLRPKVFAALASAWVVPSLVGPLVAGAVTEHVGWRWVFLGLIPLVVVGGALMVPSLRMLGRPPRDHDARLADPRRIVHAVAAALGVALLAHAGQNPTATSLAAGVVGLLVMVWGLRTLLPAGTLSSRPGVAAPIALRGIFAGAFFGMEAVLPLSMTEQHGYSPLAAGLPLAFSGVGWALGSAWQGREAQVDDAARRIRLLRTGFALVVVCAVGLVVTVQPGSPAWLVFPSWAVGGFGGGLTMASANVLLLRYTNDRDRGADSASLQLSDATASALTTGVAGMLVAAAARETLSYTATFTVLNLAMAALAAVGVLASSRGRRPPTA
ncbi:MAG TPA: MFS transporter [Actinomycetales bacterium]|nr:MFS transporter [Actinomycetales bacterium]